MATVDTIPVANTPTGGYQGDMPAPILGGCGDPLVAGAPDLRGTWKAVHVEREGVRLPDDFPAWNHVERIEQAADRVVVTSSGVIHDMRADGTFEHGVHDVMQTDFTTPIVVAASFEDGALVLRPQGLEGIAVRRWLEGEQMVWEYGPMFTARLERVSDPG